MEPGEAEAGLKLSRVEPEPAVFRTWVLALGLPLALILVRASFGWTWGFLGEVLIFLAWTLNAAWAAVLVVRLARSRQWSEAVFLSILPALLVAAMLTYPRPFWILGDLGDELRFLVMRPMYLEEISRTPQAGGPKLVEFDLGGMLWLHGAIVYDESDEMSLAYDQRSKAWKDRADNSDLECEWAVARPFLRFSGLTEHFYLGSISC